MEHKYAFLIDMVIPEVFKNLDKYFNSQNYSFNKILLGEYVDEAKYYNVNMLHNNKLGIN